MLGWEKSNSLFAFGDWPRMSGAIPLFTACSHLTKGDQKCRRGDLFMSDYRVNKGEVEEDQLTAAIEKSTSKIPSSAYLALALGAMAVSAGLQAWNRKHAAMFVGQWA